MFRNHTTGEFSSVPKKRCSPVLLYEANGHKAIHQNRWAFRSILPTPKDVLFQNVLNGQLFQYPELNCRPIRFQPISDYYRMNGQAYYFFKGVRVYRDIKLETEFAVPPWMTHFNHHHMGYDIL